jgi:hypothetical protein
VPGASAPSGGRCQATAAIFIGAWITGDQTVEIGSTADEERERLRRVTGSA